MYPSSTPKVVHLLPPLPLIHQAEQVVQNLNCFCFPLVSLLIQVLTIYSLDICMLRWVGSTLCCDAWLLTVVASPVAEQGLSSCGTRANCSMACGIFPDQGSNLCPLYWQADSYPLYHQGGPSQYFVLAKLETLESLTQIWSSFKQDHPKKFPAHLGQNGSAKLRSTMCRRQRYLSWWPWVIWWHAGGPRPVQWMSRIGLSVHPTGEAASSSWGAFPGACVLPQWLSSVPSDTQPIKWPLGTKAKSSYRASGDLL